MGLRGLGSKCELFVSRQASEVYHKRGAVTELALHSDDEGKLNVDERIVFSFLFFPHGGTSFKGTNVRSYA